VKLKVLKRKRKGTRVLVFAIIVNSRRRNPNSGLGNASMVLVAVGVTLARGLSIAQEHGYKKVRLQARLACCIELPRRD
jgi:hypothetical protein